MSWEVEFLFEDTLDYVNALDKPTRAKVYRLFSFIEERGPHLPAPNCKPLGDGLFELSTSGRNAQRFYATAIRPIVYILGHGNKKSERQQQRDIAAARQRLRTFRGGR
ncbi:MAG: type II toxin-antitoxin system RelE/ParE family toxin [Chloroflexi bacterium]|nr:type II toxin-antitoxin system RelE/ParE family toxin [Chloroflexota bacterium]